MIAVLKPCLFLRNPCARAALSQQERARKLCSATLRTFASIATAHFFAHVTLTSCIADHEGKHDAKGANIFHKNGT